MKKLSQLVNFTRKKYRVGKNIFVSTMLKGGSWSKWFQEFQIGIIIIQGLSKSTASPTLALDFYPIKYLVLVLVLKCKASSLILL